MKMKPFNLESSPTEIYNKAILDFNKFLVKKQYELIIKIKKEALSHTCVSYEYDPTPTAEERLQKIVKMIKKFENEFKQGSEE